MASDPSPPHRPITHRASQPPQNMPLTPAQAIAEAWKRESPETQKQWRMADVKAREQYLSPQRWGKKLNGPKM
ncbi:hypothetical protein AcV5_006716 [Taiwanofungus camphoratus]|nr:hypothetical protein AcV5_006716 [Antrodia cinnamomea]KAI0935362.1 hypothetical protein AcV7_003823 [Antrodia cinnamomea]